MEGTPHVSRCVSRVWETKEEMLGWRSIAIFGKDTAVNRRRWSWWWWCPLVEQTHTHTSVSWPKPPKPKPFEKPMISWSNERQHVPLLSSSSSIAHHPTVANLVFDWPPTTTTTMMMMIKDQGSRIKDGCLCLSFFLFFGHGPITTWVVIQFYLSQTCIISFLILVRHWKQFDTFNCLWAILEWSIGCFSL